MPYVGPFPGGLGHSDEWVVESWNSRALGLDLSTENSRVVSFDGRQFKNIALSSVRPQDRFDQIIAIPRPHLTIVITTAGFPYVVVGDTIRPWLAAHEIAALGLSGIAQLVDAPSLSAIVILDVDGHLHIRADQGSWYLKSPQLVEKNNIANISDLPRSGGVLVEVSDNSGIQTRIIRKIGGDSRSGDYSWEQVYSPSPYGNSFRNFHVSALFREALSYSFAVPRWSRLTPNGMEAIPGGDTGIDKANSVTNGLVMDLPTIHRTLIGGQGGLFLYDGQRILPVADSAPERIGVAFNISDLPSIGRVIVTTTSGLFELTGDGKLVARPMPFNDQGYPTPTIADWPAARVALVATKAGIFTLDKNLVATPVPGGDQVEMNGLEMSLGEASETGDFVLSDNLGLFLALDRGRKTIDPCNR